MVQAVVERLREDDTNTLCPNPETVYVFARDELYKGGSHSHHLFEESRGEFFDKEWLERKSSDLMAMLISLCASKDTCAKDNFLKEYQAQLSVALLKHQQYSTEKIRLEKMKQRLGESIENATVMINDMENSQRINKRIYENNHQWPMSFHGFILSRHSWIDPEEEEEKEPTMALTPLCLEAMKTYSSEYSRVQPSRSLRWLPELGRVNLTLEFKSGSLDITVDPIDATVISHFSSKDIPWTADSIAKKCGVSLEKTMKSLNFWEEQGILKMTNTGRFQLVKE
ncbi:hypothetical protein BDF14DRAFT_1886629 [Spinellus fusiger]|nr:hypothetical protein BDF14DRAFT_1886629 [Spinellus fusiger]